MDARLAGYIRGQVNQYLTDLCTIENETVVKAVGEPAVRQWVTVGTDVPCRMIRAGQQTTDESQSLAEQDAIEESYRLILRYDASIEPGYRVTVGGEVYYVASLDRHLSDRVFRSAVITKREGADG